jgi:hypothetical protein
MLEQLVLQHTQGYRLDHRLPEIELERKAR